jgi:hypothetical protein
MEILQQTPGMLRTVGIFNASSLILDLL